MTPPFPLLALPWLTLDSAGREEGWGSYFLLLP